MKKKISLLIREEGGAITVMAVIMIFAFLGIMAVVLDLGHLHTVQNELRNAADACALRGARAFYADAATAVDDSVTRGSARIPQQEAADTVKLNYTDTASNPLQVIQDVKIGVWYYDPPSGKPGWFQGGTTAGGTPDFTLWDPVNNTELYGKIVGPGIRLNVNRVGTDNYGPVGMTLASLLEFFIEKEDPSVDVRTEATAALSPLGELGEDNWDELGKPPPLQIGDHFARNPGANLNLSPDNTDAGGWQSYYDLKNPNTPLIQDLIWGRVNPPDLVAGPASSGGTPIERSNGVNAVLFSDLNGQINKSLYWKWMEMTGRTAAGLGPDDPAPQQWTVTLPVTSSDGPFVGTAEILGFSRVTINRVYPSDYPDVNKKKTIDVTVLSTSWASTGKGGGKYYGIIAIDPKLVPTWVD